MRKEAPGLTLHESKLRVWLSVSTPAMLVTLAVLFALSEANIWIWLLMGGAGAILGVFVLFDFALSVVVDDRGIARRCVLRTEMIEWGTIQRITTPLRRGIAVVTQDGRHHILIDRRLHRTELDLFATQAKLRAIEFKE